MELILFDDSESNKCIFINTVGERCPFDRKKGFVCCERHLCTYGTNEMRCWNVTDCNYKGYCKDHGAECRCKFIDREGHRCTEMIYYNYYAHKVQYCEKHNCKCPRCKNRVVSNNKFGLCSDHLTMIHICNYINDVGKRCTNNVDLTFIKPTFDVTIQFGNLRLDKQYFCQEHTCHVDICNDCIASDYSIVCVKHGSRCEYIGLDKVRCNVYCPKNKNGGMYLCKDHKCHWTGLTLEDDMTCDHPIIIKKDSNIYCEQHYKYYKFLKNEYF